MITYNEIYEAARKERYSDQLQPISKNFVSEASKYFQEKKQMTIDSSDDFSDVVLKTKKQLENAMTFFKELIVRRRKKILNLVLIATETGISKPDFENMMAFEKELFEKLTQCMKDSDDNLSELLTGAKVEEVQKNEMIMFKENVESFVGMDAQPMGPFERGQIANLPKEIVKILLDGGKVEKVYE